MADPIKRLKEIQQKIAASGKKQTAEIIQLPIWPEPTRGLPNTIARSALFNVRFKKTPRQQLKNHVVSALSGINITYTGEELRQDDETVLLQLLHLSRLQPLNDSVRFTPYSFLKAVRWPTSGQNHYRRLSDCIERLNANGLTVSSKSIKYGGSLIRKFTYVDDDSGKNLREWVVWLEPEIVKLFLSDDYSRIHWEQRLVLKKPIAQWLHSFYTGHEKPFPMKVATIMLLSEAATKRLASFRETLKKSLDDLVKIGFLVDYWIDPETDLVHVIKS